MKKNLLLLLILLANTAYAQFDTDKRLRLLSKFNTDIVLGDFAAGSGKASEIGPAQTGFGGGFTVGLPIYKNFIVSFAFQSETHRVDSNSVFGIYKEKYADSRFFTKVSGKPMFQLIIPSLEFSYRFVVRPFEVEPYLRIGMGFPTSTLNTSIERKMKDDHYRENYKIISECPGFAMTAVGAHVNVPIFIWIYGVVSAGYGWGNFDMTMKEIKTDYWGSEWRTTYDKIHVQYSAMQFQAGIQMRFGKFPKKPSKTDETKH